MRKSGSGFVWSAALIAAANVGVALAEESPPVEKFAAQLSASDVNVRRAAAYQLAQVGVSAKPALPALIKALDDADKQVWLSSISALSALGPEAAEAIPRLLIELDSRKPGGGRGRESNQTLLRSAHALSQIGGPAVPRLIEALSSEDVPLRTGAAKALAGMGPAAKDAIPALLANLGRSDAALRNEVVDALSQIGVAAKPELIAALESNESRTRSGAALALGGMGKAASDAAPALLERFPREPDAAVRVALLTALPRLDAETGKLTAVLIEALKSSDEQLQRVATDGLVTSRAVHATAIPLLTALLTSGDPTLAPRAARVLGALGPDAKAAAPELVTAVSREADPVYLEALVQIGDAGIAAVLAGTESLNIEAMKREHWSVASLRAFGPLAVPALTRALSDPHPPTRLIAALTLAELGREARSAEPALLRALADRDAHVRGEALTTLGAVTASPKLLLPRVKAALEDPAPPVRAGALGLIRFLADDATPLMPAVVAALHDADENVRRAAIGAVGPGAEEAVPVLIERLSDEAQRPAIFDALIRLGPAAAPATPRLMELFPQASKEVRLKLLNAFHKIGTGAQAALPALTSALTDADAEIRAGALTAFASIESDAGKKVSALSPALDAAEPAVRVVAMNALGAMGEAGAGAAPQLVTRLNSEKDRGFALEALRKIQVRDVPSLIAMLKVSDGNVRVLACERLAALGPAAAEALPHLQAVLEGTGKRVRTEALKTIEKISAAPM